MRTMVFLILAAICGCDGPSLTQEGIDFKQREFEACMAIVETSDANAVRACEIHSSTRQWQQEVVDRNKSE